MPTADRAVVTALNSRLWWDLVLLAVQSLAIGVAASVALGLVVFAMA